MPPNDPNDTTRRVIDVNLAMPQGTMQVMDQLIAQMARLTPMVAALSSDSPEGRVAAARHMAADTYIPGHIPGRGTAVPALPGKRSDGVSESASHPNKLQGFAADLHDIRRENPSSFASDLTRARQEAQRNLANIPQAPEVTSPFDAPWLRNNAPTSPALFGYQQSGPSPSASVPPKGSNAALALKLAAGQAWINHRIHNASEGIEERTGFSAQQIQNYVRNSTHGLLGGKPPPRGGGSDTLVMDDEPHHGGGGAAMNLAQSAGIAYLLNGGHKARAEGERLVQGQYRGIEAGFDRPGQINIPGTNIGISNPIDLFRSNSAFRETFNQRINMMRLRMQGGINGEQASGIINGLASRGWTGEVGQNMAFDYLAPLVQQGQNPDLLAKMFDQAARNGTAPLQELAETLNQLGPSARAAHMSLTEYGQGLDEFANQLQDKGATYVSGVQTAHEVTRAFGTSPQQAGQLAGSPLTAAMAATQFGALPWESGMLGTAGTAGSISGAMNLAMQAFSGFRDTPLRNPDGSIRVSGRERQIAGAAQAMGVSADTMRRALEGQKVAPHILQGEAALKNYKQYSEAGTRFTDYARKDFTGRLTHPEDLHLADKFFDIATHPRDLHLGRKAINAVTHPTDTLSDIIGAGPKAAGNLFDHVFHPDKFKDAENKGKTARTYADRQFDAVVKQMTATANMASDPDTKSALKSQIKDIQKENDPAMRVKKAEEFLSRASQQYVDEQAGSKVQVEFTGPAKAWFKQAEGSMPDDFRKADKGGRPRSESALADQSTNYMTLFRNMYGVGGR